MRKTRNSLFLSIVSLLLCASMLVGTTFAWFTDGVSTGANVIAAGNLDVELDYMDASGNWQPVSEETELFDKDALWEPGYTEVVYLRVRNEGSLALKYQLGVRVASEIGSVNVNGDAFKLSDYIYFGAIDDVDTKFADRASARAEVTAPKLISAGHTKNGTMEKGAQPQYMALVVYMPESADNAANYAVGEVQPRIQLGVELVATQMESELDSFGSDYDAAAGFPEINLPDGGKTTVDVQNGTTTADATISGDAVSATVPSGVAVNDGATELELSVTEMAASGSNITLADDEIMKPVDVHVEGVSASNTTPIAVVLKGFAPKGLNAGNLKLYHVESGKTNAMTHVAVATPAHNEFTYDPATGDVTLYLATFSEITSVASTTNAWNGNFDYSWYTGAVALADGESTADYVIANADQLAAFGAIVGGMDGQTQDSFADKTVKLISDINLGDDEKNNVADKIFYPIGYYNSDGTYEKTNIAITSGFKTFEGTFDGTGHTIANFYQNTWEMKGDHNWYDASLQYYRDGMGLFGKVYGGTVKNLTIENFSSDGEIATTGCIAAYADCGAAFENISIFNCNPRVYNVGNGGIVGCVGWYANDADRNNVVTFKNITVDNSNKISALWGSYDVACGGLVGQYYPTSGQSNAIDNAGIRMENCHVAAQMDVYNDVCANYQYYAYRYAGMLIGSIRENVTVDGHVYPNMDGITAKGCTVHFGTWNDYYYCELVANSEASYTHDHQMSRLEQVASVDAEKKTVVTLKGETVAIPTSGAANYVVVNGNHATENATCYHFVDGEVWSHEKPGFQMGVDENGDGKDDLVEDKQHIYLEFNNLFTGYGWGVTSKGLTDFEGVTNMDITAGDQEASVTKFETKFTGDFLYRVGNQNTVSLGSLFAAAPMKDAEGNTIADKYYEISDSGVVVSIDKVDENTNVSGTFTANTSDWTQGTIQFSGTGPVKLTIQDYDYCKPTVLYLEVVDAENITSATAGTGKDFVLLKDVTYNGTYLYYKNSTLYGNGFTIDITGADHSDLKDASDTNSNKFAYCNIWMVNSKLDNISITGSVYPEVGMTADSDYGNAAIRTEGDCYITNSYISNCRVPLRVQGNTTLINTVVDGGRYANIELRSGKLTLDGVTTINTVRKGSDGATDVIGFGIVIHSEAANASIAVIGDGLKQYNWAGKNKHKSVLSGDTNLSNAYKLIFNANNSENIYFDYNSDRYVNTGILCLCADIKKDAVTGVDDRYCQEISGYDAWVLTYDNSKHTAWFNESIGTETIVFDPEQGPVIPEYSGNEAQTVEFTKGETYYFDTSVLTAKKFGNVLSVSAVVLNGTTYNYGDKIPITEGGVYEVVYTVQDPYNYNSDASSTVTEEHIVSITVTAIAKDAEILAPKFTFIDQNGNKYESTTVKAGDKTYVMPNVTAADPTTNSMSSINIGSASISGTTVYFPVATGYTVRNSSNFNRYYPLFNGINITDYTIAGDTTGTTYTTSGNYTTLVGSSGTKFIIPANGGQTNCGDYVKTDGQSGNAAGNSDSGWQGAGYSTSYGGTYLKSGNTNASRGADSNGYERIVWVEYCFNAGNGDVYYYRIGYHCNKESAQTCVTGDTLITLADGSQKRIDQLTGKEQLLVWNHETGKLDTAPVAYIVDHDGEVAEREITHLYFSDGSDIRIIGQHVFFDATLGKYITLDASAAQYIDHFFAGINGQNSALTKIKLIKVEKEYEKTAVYEVVSYKKLTCFTDGILSASAYMDKLLNVFGVNTSTMAYNSAEMKKDIEKYGLYTYADFEGLISEEAFELYNAAYLKIAVGKGYITWDDILDLIDIFYAVEVIPIQ